jgi:hypothetical protein
MGTRQTSNTTCWARAVLIIAGLGIGFSIMASCGSSVQPHQLIAIVVSPSGAGANQGDTVPFSATGTFAQAPMTQTNIPAQWTSSDTSTATVNPSTGAATCVAVGGPVTITASAAGMAGPLQSSGNLTCAAQGSGPVKLVPNTLTFVCQYDSAMNKCLCNSPEESTLTNSLSTSLTIDGITASGTDFSEVNSCGASVGPGQSCRIIVSWSPTRMTGLVGVDGLVTISDSDSTSPQGVRLVGVARQCAP